MRTLTAWAPPQPGNEAARPLLVAGERARIHINNGNNEYSDFRFEAQRCLNVPRIIATHWLRPDVTEVAHG